MFSLYPLAVLFLFFLNYAIPLMSMANQNQLMVFCISFTLVIDEWMKVILIPEEKGIQ